MTTDDAYVCLLACAVVCGCLLVLVGYVLDEARREVIEAKQAETEAMQHAQREAQLAADVRSECAAARLRAALSTGQTPISTYGDHISALLASGGEDTRVQRRRGRA